MIITELAMLIDSFQSYNYHYHYLLCKFAKDVIAPGQMMGKSAEKMMELSVGTIVVALYQVLNIY